jgi:peptidase E
MKYGGMESMIKYLLSQVNGVSGFGTELSECLKNDINPNKIVFIPTTPNLKNKTKHYVDIILNCFNKSNIFFEESVILYGDTTLNVMVEHLKNTDVIFLMGGDTLQQYSFIKEYDLVPILQEFEGVMIGMSAGAINMCKKSILTPQNGDGELKVYDGFNIVDISIEVHFQKGVKEQEDLLQELTKSVNHLYCISDYSAIRFDSQDQFHTIGDGIFKVTENTIIGLGKSIES